MKYCDLRPAIAAYARGDNVTALLRQALGESANSSEIIEIAYDLQAGTYIDHVRRAADQWRAYTGELAAILAPRLRDGDRVLEAGTGEMTTFAGVAAACGERVGAHYAMDISWSRIRRGREFIGQQLAGGIADKTHAFVADLFHLPLRDRSIDVVWTSHALEPNGGRERQALTELLRVARRHVVLFEPSYENNTAEGQARMRSLGYIRALPDVIAELGARLEAVLPISAVANPLNPTFAYVIAMDDAPAERPHEVWACPATGLAMSRRPTCFWSDASRLAYPVIEGIPVLRPEAAVLATALG